MTYDMDNPPIIYVRGDGAGWICNALDEAFMHGIHVRDAYHWMKVVRSVSRLFPRSRVPERVRKAVENDGSNVFEKIIKGLKKNAQPDKTKLDVVEKMEKYYTNHWDAIRYSLDENILGSCTEPLVQHLLAARTTAVPSGWSLKGLEQMAAIRTFTQDGNQVTKLKLTDEERARSCRARYQALKEELEKRPLNWSTFDKERTPYNGGQRDPQKTGADRRRRDAVKI